MFSHTVFRMGLGKTIQSVASMAMYMNEWPLLVITPSGARFHWEHEFLHWMRDTLRKEHVHVLSNRRDIIPPKAKVVICSYGLIKSIPSNYFKCAICDESHMLKNASSQRTKTLAPILRETRRCLLLSGTPAFAKPAELWPQLDILGIGQYGWNIDQDTFEDKYGKGSGNKNSPELHTMLTGTVMIRRLKADILKSMPRKIRTLGRVFCVKTPNKQIEFRRLITKLKESNGILGSLIRKHGLHDKDQDDFGHENKQDADQNEMIEEKERQFQVGCATIRQALSMQAPYLPHEQFAALERQAQQNLRMKLDYESTSNGFVTPEDHQEEHETKTNTLNTLYSLTAEVKIPLVVDMLNRWLNDDTKGKVCIFAHHLSLLDALQSKCMLNDTSRKFIRIDGGTSPRNRQDQITAFQTDPSIRVALLGITAAGVAVTLTAASTVWFAELFWTPAIMIQAEDRCHRIGQ